MGLYDSYASICSQILVMNHLPSVTKVYSILHQEEKQCLLHIFSVPTESVAMVVPCLFSYRSDNKGRGYDCPKYDYCDCDGHWKSHCYKLHGYPKNKPQYRETFNGQSGSSMAVNNATSPSTSSEITIIDLTSDQYNRLLDLLSPLNTNSANFASNLVSCHSTSFPNHEWIIDLGTSDHRTSNWSSLNNVHPLHQPCPIKLSNGDVISITHTGTLHVSFDISLSNVLYVPLFKFNLLSISKLTINLNCIAIFYFVCFSGPMNEEAYWNR